jgi:hypothetical protein
MQKLFWYVPALVLIAVSGGEGGPLKGAHTQKVRIGARSQMEFEEKYNAGRRACVIAMGDHKPPVEISIAVYDDAKELVTEERSVDYVAVIWYSPRAASYKIVVKNTGEEYNEIYLVFK